MTIPFDRAAEVYDQTRGFPAEVITRIAGILNDELNGCEPVLDAGVGTGRFALPLQILNIRVVGIDISRKMMMKAVEKGVKGLLFADVRHLPFRDKAFDATISVHVLHLVKEWRQALSEIVRVTRKALFSVLAEDDRRGPREVYKEFLERIGYSYRHPGLGEWDLRKRLNPAKSIFASSYETCTSHDLCWLDKRAFSSQWNVPDDLHSQAMLETRKIFSVPGSYSEGVYVHRWSIATVMTYLDSIGA